MRVCGRYRGDQRRAACSGSCKACDRHWISSLDLLPERFLAVAGVGMLKLQFLGRHEAANRRVTARHLRHFRAAGDRRMTFGALPSLNRCCCL